MSKFLVAFRLKDDASYEKRYDAVIAAVNKAGSGFWEAGTSLIALETGLNIDGLGRSLKAAINELTDLVFIRQIDVKNTAVIGDPGEGFDYFFPEAKKL